jgi:hypothetical protein
VVLVVDPPILALHDESMITNQDSKDAAIAVMITAEHKTFTIAA